MLETKKDVSSKKVKVQDMKRLLASLNYKSFEENIGILIKVTFKKIRMISFEADY